MQRITSRHNARVKEVAKLRQRRQRERQQRTMIDGRREIARALEAGVELVDTFVCECSDSGASTSSDETSDAHDAESTQAVVAALEAAGVTITLVTPEVYEKLRFGERDDGVVAVARTPQRSLDQIKLPPNPLVAVLEGLEKPGNIGAVLRSADGAGVDLVVLANPRTDLFNPNTIRASLGMVFARTVCTATVAETLAWLRQHHIAMYAARPEGAVHYANVDLSRPAALVLGSEANGLSDVWNQDDVAAVSLPMLGQADSLNVSATAAVLFYEARRQRDRSVTGDP